MKWLSAIILFLANAVMAQPGPSAALWTHLPGTPREKVAAERWVQPLQGELFQMDEASVRAKLAKARAVEPSMAVTFGNEIELPMPDGTTARFKVVEAPVMAPELAAKFPEIKTYAGQGIDDPTATVRMDLTPAGFHAQILSSKGAVYVDPAFRGDAQHHVSYFKRDFRKLADDWECHVLGRGTVSELSSKEGFLGVPLSKTQSGSTLRTYRLAVAATGEYTAFHGGTRASGQAAIVTAINRVNQIYEAELAVRLVLVANNDLLVFTNATTDPYTNDDGGTMLGQNQSTVDAIIGDANYDIGHVFSTGGGGIAWTPSVCENGFKAQGVTGSTSPNGDSFWVDYVAHEMGHQFGANHTFNSETDNCGGGNRNAVTAYEPGSGSTIMAYAGICAPNNLQPHSDPYFHAVSLDEIQATIAGSASCAFSASSGNTAPTVNAGSDYTIPASTPFALTAVGSDPNADPINYCWEELDRGAATALANADNGSSPLFRSLLPASSPVRYFPKLSSVLANTNWNQEKLPTLSRTAKFRVTVRDNRSGGGGVADDEMNVSVVGGAGPFVVTSPNSAVSWSGARTVTWNVAGTASAPINASGVNLYLSTNGGNTFTFLLATNVPNTGSAAVVLPNLSSSQARIKVQGAGNIFYDVSDVNFSVAPGSPVPLVTTFGTALIAETCTPTNGFIDPYETVTVNWTLVNGGTAPTTNLVATLLSSNGVYFPGSSQNYGVIPSGGTVSRSFSFVPAGVCGGTVTGMLALTDGGADLGVASSIFALGSSQSGVVTQSFANAGSITIPSYGTATPYPSSLLVSGVSNPVTKLTVTLKDFSHEFAEDVFALVVAPSGQKTMLVNYSSQDPAISVYLTFDDDASDYVPYLTSIPSGTYLPTDYYYSVYGTPYNLPAPAPSGPYGSTLAPLAISPNGTWSLYVWDFATIDGGDIAEGWQVNLISSNATQTCSECLPPVGSTSAIYSNNAVNLSWQSLPGVHYQVHYRTNLALGSWQPLGSLIPGTGSMLGTNDVVTGDSMRFYRIQVLP